MNDGKPDEPTDEDRRIAERVAHSMMLSGKPLTPEQIEVTAQRAAELRVAAEGERRVAVCKQNAPDVSGLLERFGPDWEEWAAVDCGVGWHALLDRMDERIRAVDPQARYKQIKEKFAGLRVSLAAPVEPGVMEAIDEATAEAAVTCELCGTQPARPVRVGWHHTLCGVHAALHIARVTEELEEGDGGAND